MKGVLITKENQQQLMARYKANVHDLDMFPIDHILVTEFGDNGDDRYEGVVTEAKFNELFVKGEALNNGFFSISRKI